MKLSADQWFYHPTKGGQLYRKGEILPKGWYDTPDNFPKTDEKPAVSDEKGKIAKMKVDELYDYAKTFGITLDKRKSRLNMLKQFEEALMK